MKICLLGFHNLPVLAPEYRGYTTSGEGVQQTLLARALARRGHDVSIVTWDYGQQDGERWDGIRVYKTYRPQGGIPGLRFVYPRGTSVWTALERADADLYYHSCAGMQVALLALFCRRHRRRFVFRTASDSDCDPKRLLVHYARDRWLYAWGLRRADAILVQSIEQAHDLARNYGLESRVAGMLVERPEASAPRDIDLLWVGNIRPVKRPDRALALAAALPEATLHMVGGPLLRAEALYDEFREAAARAPNVRAHGPLSYWDANALYARARVLVNTSDVEGFPNSYLQAWIRGVPVVTLIDPDGVIEREGLGVAVRSAEELPRAVRSLLDDPLAWKAASVRCRQYMAREHGEERTLSTYLETFDEVMRAGSARRVVPGAVRHA